MNAQISPKDWERLSAYIDDQLPPKEKEKLRQQLEERPELRTAYQEIQQLKAIFRAVPRKRAPRNFTLSQDMVRSRPPIFKVLVPAFSFTSAVASLLLIILFIFQLTPGLTLAGEAPMDRMAVQEEMMAAEAVQEKTPEIITWGSPYAEGLGGGGGEGFVEPAPQALVPPAADAVPEEELPAEEAPEQEMEEAEEIPQEKSAPAGTPTPQGTLLPSEDYGLILGVQPTEERGQVIKTEAPVPALQAEPAVEPNGPNLVLFQIILAVIAVSTGLAALLIHRETRS